MFRTPKVCSTTTGCTRVATRVAFSRLNVSCPHLQQSYESIASKHHFSAARSRDDACEDKGGDEGTE